MKGISCFFGAWETMVGAKPCGVRGFAKLPEIFPHLDFIEANSRAVFRTYPKSTRSQKLPVVKGDFKPAWRAATPRCRR